MKQRTLMGGLLVCLSAVAVGAATAGGQVQIVPPVQQAPANGVGTDSVDVAFFSGKRPVLLRLHVTVHGKTARQQRDAYVKLWFDYLDRDGDGFLSPAEAAFVPNAQLLQQLRQNGQLFGVVQNNPKALANLDANQDGKVSLDELIAHFEGAGFYPLQMSGGQVQQTSSSQASQALFKHLELSKAALGTKEKSFAAADALMRKFDLDDDETVSLQELLGQPLVYSTFTGGVLGSKQAPKLAANMPFHLISPRDDPETVALKLLATYAKPGAVKLKPGDCDLGPGVFAQLDANKDGALDMLELLKWQERTPDLEFVIRIGKTGPKELPTDLVFPGGKKPALAASVTKTADGIVSLTVDDAQLSLGHSGEREGAFQVNLVRSSIVQLFRFRLDPKKGYLELTDLDGPQFQLIRQLFPMLDRDGDGKLTEKEVTAFAQLEAGAVNSTVWLTVQDHGRALFQLLDVNRDGRLSLRELRSAWERLAPLDKNGDGVISPNEITRQFQVTASLGNGRFAPVPRQGLGVRGGPVPTTLRGPQWFRKMDRHGIGDVSFRNFLGTRADFDRIDTDGDGLISAEEAERFDAQVRKGK